MRLASSAANHPKRSRVSRLSASNSGWHGKQTAGDFPHILPAMELDLEGSHRDRAHALLASLVTPRPIAWVTTVSPEGAVNASPFSFFTTAS